MQQNTVRVRLYKHRVLLHNLFKLMMITILVTSLTKKAIGRRWGEVQANKLKQ